jgi:hypothetical protein
MSLTVNHNPTMSLDHCANSATEVPFHRSSNNVLMSRWTSRLETRSSALLTIDPAAQSYPLGIIAPQTLFGSLSAAVIPVVMPPLGTKETNVSVFRSTSFVGC